MSCHQPYQSAMPYIIVCIAASPATASRFCRSRRLGGEHGFRILQRMRAIAERGEPLEHRRERRAVGIERCREPRRRRVEVDAAHPGQAGQRAFDQPGAGRAAHALDQQRQMARAVGVGGNEARLQRGRS